jgi:transcriptional regulator with PAS, ATPase and Fis domain
MGRRKKMTTKHSRPENTQRNSAKLQTRDNDWDWKSGLTGKSSRRNKPFPTLEEIQLEHSRQVLAAYGHDVDKTAKALGIARSTVYRKLKKIQGD